jgi:colicin import membrane protein
VSAQALPFEERHDIALGRSMALAAAVHVALAVVMFFGVRYQSHRPDTVTVELWEAPPPPPPPRVVQEPPKPVAPPKEEPAPEIKKPEIAIREKPKPKPKPEAKPKPEPKRDLEFERQMREQLALEQAAIEEQRRERELRDLIARRAADARAKAEAAWMDKIRTKIRSNIPTSVLDQVSGNPEAIFDVTLLPTGEVLNGRLRRSSGNPLYDQAIERAILKSSPLPKPDDPKVFQRSLELKFRPLDK